MLIYVQVNIADDGGGPGKECMRIAIAHAHRLTREVLAKVISNRLGAESVTFCCLEDLFASSMNYDVFIVFNQFGVNKMDGWQGAKWLRHNKPDARVIFMNQKRFFERKFLPPGTDQWLFCPDDDMDELVKMVKSHQIAQQEAQAQK